MRKSIGSCIAIQPFTNRDLAFLGYLSYFTHKRICWRVWFWLSFSIGVKLFECHIYLYLRLIVVMFVI